jgi:hypothetical protein
VRRARFAHPVRGLTPLPARLIFWWRGERDVKDTFQRWRSYMLEKRRRRAAVKCVTVCCGSACVLCWHRRCATVC